MNRWNETFNVNGSGQEVASNSQIGEPGRTRTSNPLFAREMLNTSSGFPISHDSLIGGLERCCYQKCYQEVDFRTGAGGKTNRKWKFSQGEGQFQFFQSRSALSGDATYSESMTISDRVLSTIAFNSACSSTGTANLSNVC